MGGLIQKNLTWVAGIFTSLVALAVTFENFTNLHLVWRLLTTGLAGILILVAIVSSLSRWVRPDPAVPGFGQDEGRASRRKLLLSAVALALICAVFVFLAWLQTDRFILKIDQSHSDELSSATLFAPSRMIDSMMVQLPGPEMSDCSWRDLRTNSFPRLRAQTIDWDSPIRKLRIDNFVHPQVVDIQCRPPTGIPIGVHMKPPSTEVFLASQLRVWQLFIYVLGGLSWIAAIWRLISS